MATGVSSQALASAQDAVLRAARALVEGNVLSLTGHGNISVRIPETDRFVLTAGGTLSGLGKQDLAVLDLQGNVVEGEMSSVAREIIQMHAAIYRKRDDVGSVIHTHSPHVTGYAIAGKPIPLTYEAMVRFDITEPVPVAAYGPRGSQRSVQNIVAVVGPNTRAVLLANHGILVFDRDAPSTVQLVFVLEEAAAYSMYADVLGGAQPIPPELLHETIHRQDELAQAGE